MHCGLVLRSELELPLRRCDGDPDVEVAWGATIPSSLTRPQGVVIAESTESTRPYTVSDGGSEFLVRFPECGEFAIASGLDAVEVRPSRHGANERLLPLLMVGAVGAILHELRGSTVLHASAVATEGTALAFAGRSGQGKSTIAAWLCTRGAELVTDDVLLVESDPAPVCAGAASAVRLRSSARALAEAQLDFDVRSTADGRTALTPPRIVSERLPLRAIVLPIPVHGSAELEVVEMPATSQLLALLACPRIDGWTRAEIHSRRFDTVAGLVGTVPVYCARIPWDGSFDPSVASALMDLGR